MPHGQDDREHKHLLKPEIPNAETRKVLEETDDGIGLVECKNIEDLFNKIGL